jgi:hypothetical protein
MKKNNIVFIIVAVILALLPAYAMAADTPPDGAYTVEVELAGGAGKATVESPAALTVEDGGMQARIAWSSPYYDFMLIGDTYYYPVNTEGNSVFEIPVLALDTDIAFSAETLAMSEPHVIDYTLRFDSATLKEAGEGEAAVTILAVAAVAAAVVAAGMLLRAKRKKGR